MSNTGWAQLGVHPHPARLHPAVSVLPVCTAELGRRTAQSHAHLSVLLCSAVCKEPFPSTHQVPAASRDRGSNPDSIKVQWCHETQEPGLNSRILSRKPLPAALHPLWATHQTLQFTAQHCLPKRRWLEVTLLQCLPPSPGVNRLSNTSGHIPRPASPDGCPGSLCLPAVFVPAAP